MDMMQFWSRISSCIADVREVVGIEVGVVVKAVGEAVCSTEMSSFLIADVNTKVAFVTIFTVNFWLSGCGFFPL